MEDVCQRTVNDLAVSGACPKYISVGMIIEAGLAVGTLKRLVDSIAATAREPVCLL